METQKRKPTFIEFLVRFRQTKKHIYHRDEKIAYSNKHGLDLETGDLPESIYTYGDKGFAYLFYTEKIGYWTELYNQQPCSPLISDVEWELAQHYYTEYSMEEFFDETSFLTEIQVKEYNSLMDTLDEFKKVWLKLSEHFYSDVIEANTYLQFEYPFEMSLDEYNSMIVKWVDTAKEKIAVDTYLAHTDPMNSKHQAHKE